MTPTNDRRQCPVCDREDWDIGEGVIKARYDGCVGLNPAAYRACVEALKAVEKYVPREGSDYCKLTTALTQATQEASQP